MNKKRSYTLNLTEEQGRVLSVILAHVGGDRAKGNPRHEVDAILGKVDRLGFKWSKIEQEYKTEGCVLINKR